MTRSWSKLVAITFLASGFAGLAIAEDEKKDDEKKPAPTAKPADGARIDWSGFVIVSTSTGEVTKVDEDGFTMRISWLTAQGGSGRPNYGKNAQNHRPQVKSPKETHEDFDLKFADQGLVRWKTLPKRTDEKGKTIPYTDKEMKEFHKPEGIVYYAADRTDLKVGHIVEVTVLRPKEIKADKATTADLRVKTAVIIGVDPKPVAEGEKKKK